ncbi:hypothetical protein [Sulfuracidifex tepidarius]|nr:hypothetical protein [Sulfuracidifex tepidarius]
MQVQIPIAILSLMIGTTQGMDAYSGPLYSLYLRKFNKRKESYAIPFLTVGLVSWAVLFRQFVIEPVVVGVIICSVYGVKFLFWRYHHVSLSFRPEFSCVAKQLTMNTFLGMDFLLPVILAVAGQSYLLLFLTSLISTRVVSSFLDDNKIRKLAIMNMDGISSILGMIMGLTFVASYI